MGWNFAFIVFVWIFAQFSLGVDYAKFYPQLIDYVSAQEIVISGYAGGGAMCLVLFAYLMRGLGFYSVVYLISKIAFALSQLTVCAVSFAAVAFWFYVPQNLWTDLSIYALAVPFLWLGASSASLWIFDFNYPISERLYNNILVAIISVVLTLILTYFGIRI